MTSLYNFAKLFVFVLKGDSMVEHHIGPNRMHPDRSFCLSWSGNDQVVSAFSEQKLRRVYSTVHALGPVPAGTIPRDGTVSATIINMPSLPIGY